MATHDEFEKQAAWQQLSPIMPSMGLAPNPCVSFIDVQQPKMTRNTSVFNTVLYSKQSYGYCNKAAITILQNLLIYTVNRKNTPYHIFYKTRPIPINFSTCCPE